MSVFNRKDLRKDLRNTLNNSKHKRRVPNSLGNTNTNTNEIPDSWNNIIWNNNSVFTNGSSNESSNGHKNVNNRNNRNNITRRTQQRRRKTSATMDFNTQTNNKRNSYATYHDYEIMSVPCTRDNECKLGSCNIPSRECKNLFNARHIPTNVLHTLYSFGGVSIFQTDANRKSVESFYQILLGNKFIMYNLLKNNAPLKLDTLSLNSLAQNLFKCNTFIDGMNIYHTLNRDYRIERYTIINNIFKNIILTKDAISLITFQNYLINDVLEIIKGMGYLVGGYMYNKDKVVTLVIENKCIIIFTPSPKLGTTGLELDDYMLYYMYTKLRMTSMSNRYISNDGLSWIVPKNSSGRNSPERSRFNSRSINRSISSRNSSNNSVTVKDIFLENNDKKIANRKEIMNLVMTN